MNVILCTEPAGFIENGWVGHTLGLDVPKKLGAALFGSLGIPGPNWLFSGSISDISPDIVLS
jgi:hypothetical protein